MGVDQLSSDSVSKHDHSSDDNGGADIVPSSVDAEQVDIGGAQKFRFEQDQDGNLYLRKGTAGQIIKLLDNGEIKFRRGVWTSAGFYSYSEFNFQDTAPHYNPQDVRYAKQSFSQGDTAYHDGSNSNTVGLAHYDGSNWVSLVDGSIIS